MYISALIELVHQEWSSFYAAWPKHMLAIIIVMASNNSAVDVKTATMTCDSAIIDRDHGTKHNDRNGCIEHVIEDGDDVHSTTVDSALAAVKCIIEKSDGLQNQRNDVTVIAASATIPSVPPTIIATAPVVSNGCMSSWYSRCKWRSQSCDRKQKNCPRPRNSWINDHNSNNNITAV